MFHVKKFLSCKCSVEWPIYTVKWGKNKILLNNFFYIHWCTVATVHNRADAEPFLHNRFMHNRTGAESFLHNAFVHNRSGAESFLKNRFVHNRAGAQSFLHNWFVHNRAGGESVAYPIDQLFSCTIRSCTVGRAEATPWKNVPCLIDTIPFFASQNENLQLDSEVKVTKLKMVEPLF